MTLTAAELDNQGGKAVAREALTASVSGVVGNQDGGRLSARQLSLSAQDLDNRGGEIDAAGSLNVSLSRDLDNADGRISAAQLAIVARHLDNPEGQVVADGDLTATLSGHLANRDGGTLGAERLVLTTGQFDNRDGALLAGDVRIHSQTLDNARGMISADDALALTVTQALANRQGQIQVVEGGLEARLGSLDNQQGTLVARRLSVASQGAVDNRQGQLVGDELRLDAGSLDNRQDGRLTASYLTLAIDDALDNQGGVLDADQGELQVAARRLDNRGGTLSAGQLELNFGLDPDQGIDNRDGGLLLADDLRLTAGSLSNTQGRVLGQSLVLTLAALYNAGGLISATQALGLALNGALDNQGGRLQVTDGQLQLSDATQVDNRQGVLVAQQLSLVDIGRLDNRQGQLVADGIRVAATTVDNTQQGLISAAETLDLTVQENLANASGTLEAARLNVAATRVDNTQGRLLADRIGLRATSLGNQGGAILAESDGAVITLTSQDARLDNADGVIDVADGTLAIVAAEGAIHNQAGSISADRLTLEAASLDNHDGQLAAVQGNAAIRADRFDNQAGLLAAQGGELTLDIATVDNRAGRLQGDGVRLTGARLDNRQGTLTAVERDLEVQLSGALDNGDGRMLANGVLGVDSAALTNLGGQLAGRGLSLTTGMLDNQQGLVESSAALSVDVDGLANGGGTLRSLSGQTTTLSARQRLDNRGGVIELGSRDARVNAADIDNRDGTLRHDGDGVVQLVAEQLANLNGRLQGTGGVSAELGRVEGVGQWQANGPLVLTSDAALSVGSNERLSSAMALSLRAAGLVNAGLVAANDRLTLTLDGALNNTGQLSSQGCLAVTATGLTQDGGRIASAGDASFRLSGDVTNLGRLTSQGDMTLSAASLDNQGSLGSLVDLRLDSASITNAPDTLLFAGGDMTLHTQQLFNRYGDIYSRGDLTLARNSALAKTDRLENRSGTIEAEGDMTLRAGDILNTKDRIETEDVLLDRAVAGTGYVRKVYRTEHNGQGAGDGGYEEVVTLVSTTELFREYELTETLRTTIVEDSPAAGIQAGGDLRITADTLENLDSVIAANGDIRIDAASLINSGRGNALVTRTSQYGDAEAASCLETGSFLDCFRGGTIGGGRYSYRFRETDLTDSLAGWNASSGFSDSQELLPLPAGAPDLLSQAETRTILPGGAPAVISAGGRVSITATEQLHNGDIKEHTLAQLQGRLGDTATQGPVSSLSMTLGRDADQASAQGLNAPSRVDRSGASRDASLADIGATPSTAGGGLDGALDTSAGAGFDAGGGVWVFDDAPFLRVDIAQTPSFRLPEGDYGLFVRAPEAQGRYLVETNPEFTNLEQWRGSDYLLDKLGYTDDEAYRLLGDGRYESRLIRQAVLATTGQRYLSEGLGDDYAQYRYLMDNALASKDRLSLALGVGLSPEQVAALTHDIVWLEERQIDGQTVLAPVLYLANLDSRDVRGGGVIQGRDIDLISGGDLVNVGTLRATHDLNAYAAGSVLQGGLVEAGDALNLTARDDIRNAMGGQVRGDRVSLTALEGDVVNDRLSVAAGTSRDYRSYLDQGGSISARDQLDIQAGRDVVNRGSVTSGADLSVTAGRDIVAGAVVDVSHWQDARGRDRQDNATTLGSTTTAGGDLTWQAGRDVAIDASQVLSGDDLVLAAGRDMAIVSGENSDASRDVSRRQITTTDSVTQVGSTLESGGSASLSAGGDIGLLASRVEAGEGLGLVAGGDITLASAANSSESHTRKPNKTYDTRTVRQQGSELAAGTDLTVAAGGDLTLVASTASAGDEAYLYAGGDVALLAANDEDYSRYEKNESGGLFGGDKHRLDEVQDLRAQGSEIASGGDLIIASDGDQTYEGARLDAGNDLVLDSGGEITFAHARDLHSETHEKSSSNAVWQSAKGEGETVETLRQSELVAQGERIIRAAQGVNVDIEQVDEQSIHQTITAMVEADPSLAWLAEMEARGDVDWREVKALHDQWDYDHSGMSAAAQLVVAIVVAYYVGPMATKLVAGGASTGALAAGGWANVAAATSLTSVASNAAVSTINQQGDLGEAWGDVTSSDALRGYAVAGMTAGLTNGLYNGWTGTQTGLTTGLPNSGTVTGAPLGTWQGAGQFGANQLLQNTTSALLDRALGGDAALGDAFQASLANTFAAAGFNAIGNTSLENGSLNKAALHAVMGGLAAEAAGGDFTTGALAAGANELLVDKLAGEYSDISQAEKGRLLVMNSQIIGVIAAEIASNDDSELQVGAQVAGSATQYNRLLHPQEREVLADRSRELAAERGEPSIGDLSWDDMFALVSGAQLDASQTTAFSDLLVSLDTSSNANNPQYARFLSDLQVAQAAYNEIRQQYAGQPLRWSDGEVIVAHGEPVVMFQASEAQYQDGSLFGTVESSYWGTGLDSAYSLGATVQHQDEMASIGSAGSADTIRVYDQAYWSAMGGGAEVDTTDVDIVLTLSGGGVAAKAAASGIRGWLQSRVLGGAGVSFRQAKVVLESAQRPYKGSSVIGHALSKHANRHPEIWGGVTGPMSTWNAQAMTHLREVVRGSGRFQRVTNDRGVTFIEKRIDDGRGIRLNLDGTFKGFID
ncbi:DUF637 domain-containing protein [Halomonas sp. DP8Y7-1]|uniref:DUF637 domain-containing protein n=1 Tax=Halomonas sp. DP8Y7-1 TaxID=2859078 RepID=UPI0021BD49CB|nr:DUF637 domain-containing protein [Halomonas sp. DP8Y7-1]